MPTAKIAMRPPLVCQFVKITPPMLSAMFGGGGGVAYTTGGGDGAG